MPTKSSVTKSTKTNRKSSGTSKKKKKPKLSRLQKPENMSLEEWQLELRRQYGREQDYHLESLDEEKFFGEFRVHNPKSKRSYHLILRGDQPFDNYCSCPDFATNTLGTCKHIEFTLAKLRKRRGGPTAFKTGFHSPYSEIYLHYGMQRQVRFRAGTECPKKLATLIGKYFSDEGNLSPEAFAAFDIFLDQATEIDSDLRIADDAVAFVAEVRDAEHRRKIVDEMFPAGIRSDEFTDLVKATLYDYQKEGVLFAARAGRCLIGDEMGLGKTIQSLAAAEIMARLFGVERVLIVCPTSLKHQWQHEIHRFTDRTSEVIGGSRGRRMKGFKTDTFFKIMNYDTVHTDLDLIGKWEPDLVILDEAQRIKNWNTRVARHVKEIRSPYAVVLTGTPLENRLEELISITQFVDHHRLGPTFKLLHQHQVRDEVGKVIGYEGLDSIGRTLAPVLLRRRKAEVLDQLPERIDSNIFVPMTTKQMELHQENKEIVSRIVQKWRKYRFLSEADQRRLMVALERMRMSCDSTYLVDHQSDHGTKADEAVVLLEEILDQADAKVVIFSQWLRMHELLLRRLEDKPWNHVAFHGGVPGTKRKTLIDRFREDPECRLFLSTDAGGVGLNLQHATTVMNMDLPWNPAVLEQRIGRVHRLGQKQSVRVLNFVAQGTIEQGMLSVLKFKKSLFAGVLDGGDSSVFLGRKLDKFIEQVEAATGSIPESMIEDAEDALRAPSGAYVLPTTDDDSSGDEEQDQQDRSDTHTDAPPTPADPWSNLLQAGMSFLSQLAEASGNQNEDKAKTSKGQGGGGTSGFVQQDEKTGESFLKLPMPSPEVLQQINGFLKQLQK